MTPAQFRKLALAQPGAEEHSHMGHPDFRLPGKGKIFATLQPDKGLAMVKITPEKQGLLVHHDPEVFVLFGGWSKDGSTGIRLDGADPELVADLLCEAYEYVSAGIARTKTVKRSGPTGKGKAAAAKKAPARARTKRRPPRARRSR